VATAQLRERLTTNEERLAQLHSQAERLERHLGRLRNADDRYSGVRLATFVAGGVAAVLAYFVAGPWPALAILVAAALLFGGVVYFHLRILASIARHQVRLARRRAQIARATVDWEGIPAGFHHEARPSHPFEADLNLVGPRSLHQLLDTAISLEGSQRLREWLTEPVPAPEATQRRQRLVRELLPRRLFRERLALSAAMAAGPDSRWRASDLLRWLERHDPVDDLRRWLLLLGPLAALNISLFAANQLGMLPPFWQITLILYIGLWFARARSVAGAWGEAMELQGALRQLVAVFRRLETGSYAGSPNLAQLCAPFADPARRPSRYLSRLTPLVTALGLRGNPVLHFALNAIVPWDLYFAHRLSRYKREIALPARGWMDVWFQLEALISLATAAYLNPDHTFPELTAVVEPPREPVFSAAGLGHPLIRYDVRVRNDFTVPELGQVAIITGSNMAGKSVFLKAVGVNLVLAHAGGAVCAHSLRALYFRVFTSIAITDSIAEGISYFYAEVRRLRALLTALEEEQAFPLLYCVDEIFRGTNNRERLIGGRAFVRALAGMRGTGLIATHDLDLTRLAEEVPQVVNYHFRDDVVGDRMSFDYRLRPGPSPTTNALRIMRLQGLPVPPQDGPD
jgi:hypothetical protein